ncbi:sugar phosphate isomerase/epimerase family protein [Ilumatobacter nonamiensis]|uniref:sugar phosphate isomerase/epimerase family protein n=1 Tax=Ilumatobacter nonamiensis TaxID=467093 RepID=UPI00034D5A80|nr:TIM barrel protein [Ilumatobacter nonamiensis]
MATDSARPVEADALGPEHLVLSHFSLGAEPFEVRCAAAGAAGFDGIGLLYRDYTTRICDGHETVDDFIAVAASHGLRIVEIEAVVGWSAATPDGARSTVDVCVEMARVFGARHVTATGGFDGTVDDAARGFARLCDLLVDDGVAVGLEPLPVQEVSDIAIARQIVELARRANGGLCVDSWHLERGGARWDQLESLPGDLVTSIQINDGTRTPEHDHYIEDCLWNRRLCGDGEFDLARFVRTLDRIGATAPYSVEIISTDLSAQDPFDVARRMADTTRSTLAAART